MTEALSAAKSPTSICCNGAPTGDKELILVEGLLIIKQGWVEAGAGGSTDFHEDCKLWDNKSPKEHELC